MSLFFLGHYLTVFKKYSRIQEYFCGVAFDSLMTTDFSKQFLTTEKSLAAVFGVKNAFVASFGRPGWGQKVTETATFDPVLDKQSHIHRFRDLSGKGSGGTFVLSLFNFKLFLTTAFDILFTDYVEIKSKVQVILLVIQNMFLSLNPETCS